MMGRGCRGEVEGGAKERWRGKREMGRECEGRCKLDEGWWMGGGRAKGRWRGMRRNRRKREEGGGGRMEGGDEGDGEGGCKGNMEGERGR